MSEYIISFCYSYRQEIVAEEKEAEETESEPKNENSTSAKSSPKRQKAENTEDAFGNDSTVYDESDDSDNE